MTGAVHPGGGPDPRWQLDSGPDAESIRVLVVDDDPLARHAVAVILSGDPAISVVGVAADGAEAEAQVVAVEPDVVLLDIRMPGQDGLTALRNIRRDRASLPVVMLTTFSDHGLISAALTAGAAGFLLKTSAPEDLCRAVRAAHHGGLVLSPSVSRWVVEDWVSGRSGPDDSGGRLDQLTARQRDVLAALSDGSSNAEIGRALHLSEGTVKGYVSDIITALGVRNRLEAALLLHRSR